MMRMSFEEEDTVSTTAPPVEAVAKRRRSRAPRKALLVLHIVASVALLGEVWGLVVLNLTATLADDPVLAESAYQLMSRLVFLGGIPLSLTSLATGIILAVRSPWGLVRYYWVFVKLLLNVAVICVGMFLFTPEASATGVADGTLTPARQWEQVAVLSTQVVMLLTATTLAVFKPRKQTGLRRSARAV